MNAHRFTCLLCARPSAKMLDSEGESLVGVTSDAKPWAHMGVLLYCAHCGHVQKHMNARWLDDVVKIYAEYSVHSVQGGDEQLCFDAAGTAKARARMVVESLDTCLNLPPEGAMLDFGCGMGSFLRHFGAVKTGWTLYGQELCEHFRERVMSVSNVAAFFCDITDITACFDLITLNDVLEHVTDPVAVMTRLRDLLKPRGRLFVRSPSFVANPFDLSIVDHCSHFTRESLDFLLRATGLEHGAQYAFMPKEIGFIAQRAAKQSVFEGSKCCFEDAVRVFQTLKSDIDHFAQALSEKNYVLGCSVAGVWAAHMLEQRKRGCIAAFVDEDRTRHGEKGPMGLLVSSLEACTAHATVLLPFPAFLARELEARLSQEYPLLRFVCPS